ncbi:MAG: P-loop NTPase [Phycisphaerales bacterium]|jgi:ATP-binding protein involved in chromosome partitioning|nr:P-loop NTPase [Phycisphaerales bacterium]
MTSCAQVQSKDVSMRELDEGILQTNMGRIGQKILVLSGKGGVGKSTVAANLAVALSKAGKRVGLLDVDLHGPSIPKILGLEGMRLCPDAMGHIEPIMVSETLSVISVGLLLDKQTDAVVWRGPMKQNVIRQFLKDGVWGDLDVLVVDSPPGTGDEPLAVAEMVGENASAVIVTTPQDVAIADVRRSVSFCRMLELPIAGIIENMSGLACPHCGEIVDLFKTGGGGKLAREMGVPFLGCIPLDPDIVSAGDSGTTFTQSSTNSLGAQAFASVIAPILNPISPAELESNSKEPQSMKIAIPTAQGELCMHFGHCEQFTMIEVDPTTKSVLSTEMLTPPPHEPGVLPRWLSEQGANLIIAGGMGQRAQGLFVKNGINVIVGAPGKSPEVLALSYLNNTLESGANACDH